MLRALTTSTSRPWFPGGSIASPIATAVRLQVRAHPPVDAGIGPG
jgi:hypothetical protein